MLIIIVSLAYNHLKLRILTLEWAFLMYGGGGSSTTESDMLQRHVSTAERTKQTLALQRASPPFFLITCLAATTGQEWDEKYWIML